MVGRLLHSFRSPFDGQSKYVRTDHVSGKTNQELNVNALYLYKNHRQTHVIKEVMDLSTAKKAKSAESPRIGRPGVTPEARENQIIAKAIDRAEQMIDDGTASSQIIVHYLKLGTTKERAELEKLRLETELVKAKTEAIRSAKQTEELYAAALTAMREYSGNRGDEPI